MTTIDEQLTISKQKLSNDLRSLSPSSIIELFELDVNNINTSYFGTAWLSSKVLTTVGDLIYYLKPDKVTQIWYTIISLGGITGTLGTTPPTHTSGIATNGTVTLEYLDTTNIIRFHNGTNILTNNIVWNGNTYSYFPIQATGFEFNGRGQLPRPTLTVSNVSSLVGALVRDYGDLLGTRVTRIRTLLKYIDAVNYPGGVNPTADPSAKLPDDIYYIDRKSKENKMIVEFELAAKFDIATVQLPRRQIVQNMCSWKYRGPECGYTGTSYFTSNDQACGAENDTCGKRLTSCQLRFGVTSEIPYGGFPSVGLIR